jgi:hypothetical protein
MIDIIQDNIHQRVKEKADLYIKIFWEEPWNEWYECENSGCNTKYYALSKVHSQQINECLNCWTPLKKIYDEDVLEKDRSLRSNKEWYVEKLASLRTWDIVDENSKLIWFILWWNDNINSLNLDKFDLLDHELETFKMNVLRFYPDFDFDSFYYFSEIGIEKEYRGTDDHIASKLYNSMEEQVIKNWKKFIMLRTTKKSDLPFKWFRKIWYDVVFNYNDQNDRVIMIKKIW